MDDLFAHENMRVETALLEIERQKVKLLIVTGNAIALRRYALSAVADLEIIKAETDAALAGAQRAMCPLTPST